MRLLFADRLRLARAKFVLYLRLPLLELARYLAQRAGEVEYLGAAEEEHCDSERDDDELRYADVKHICLYYFS